MNVYKALLPAFLLPLALACTATANPIRGDYTIKISSKEALLEFPGDPDVDLLAMWDDPLQRIAARNMPWIELTNNQDADAPITRFTMTIGDAIKAHFSDNKFGNLIMESETDSPGVSLTASLLGGSDDTLVIEIVGLDPGKTARFRVDLAPNDPNAFARPDFRTVFFQMNGNDTSDNSDFIVRYENDQTNMELEMTSELPDFEVDAPIYTENIVRPHYVMEPVLVFEITDAVPEPGGMACLLAALLGPALTARRRLAA